jgi:hypothetical protein
VTAEQIEGLVVATAAISAGIVMLVVEPQHLPQPLATLARHRAWVMLSILAGVVLAVVQLAR